MDLLLLPALLSSLFSLGRLMLSSILLSALRSPMTTLLPLYLVCLHSLLSFLTSIFLISILPISCFCSDLFPVDNGSDVPSLRDQSSWTPLPVASLRAVDAPGPSSADVFPSDAFLADALAADAARNPAVPSAHIARWPDVPVVGTDPWWRGSSTLLSSCTSRAFFLLLFASLRFHLCFSFWYSFHLF